VTALDERPAAPVEDVPRSLDQGLPIGDRVFRGTASTVGLAVLATVRNFLGTLDKVTRLVKVLGLVQCTPGFHEQPKVVNGFSDLMVEVFGDAGRAARSAVGTAALPSNMAVEVEAIFQVTG